MVGSYSKSTATGRAPGLGLRALVLVILSILLMFVDHRQNHLDAVRRAIGAAVYPLQIVVESPVRLWEWISQRSRNRNDLQLENSRLRTEVLVSKGRIQELAALRAENDRLRALLEARERVRGEVRVAEIMEVSSNPYRHQITLDVGKRDSVYDSQTVIDANGVVGQILTTGTVTSQAILISDPDHALPVEVNRNGLRTIAFGTGEFDRLDLPFLPNNADIQTGDLLVTSGLGGKFPPGYPVAIVGRVTRIPQEPFADVVAEPTAALDQVREVMLIWLEDQETAVEPATDQAPTEDGDE